MQTLDGFDRQFPTDEACKDYLAGKRWPDGVRCPRCAAKEKVYALKARPFHWLCKNPDCGGRNGYRFSVITHTIFQDTKVPLRLWFKVGYLMLTAKKGISALQLDGEVEVDETWIGGKDRNRHKNKKSAAVRDAAGPQRPGRTIGYGKVP